MKKAAMAWSFFIGLNAICLAQAPQVVSTSPAQNAINIPINADISITFDTDMDGATINGNTFMVHARSAGLLSGVIAYDAGIRTVTFSPDNHFNVGDVVTAAATMSIQSSEGTPLDRAYIWEFTVEVHGGWGYFVPDTVSYPIGQHAILVYAFDCDLDGDLDIAAVDSLNDAVSILKNNGNGIFADTANFATDGDWPEWICAGDFDNDGCMDLVTANNYSSSISVLINDCNGEFSAPDVYQVSDHPRPIGSTDFNGDGYNDLVVAHDCTYPPFPNPCYITILLNDGSGHFPDTSMFEIPFTSNTFYPSDYDNDYDIDLAICDGNPSTGGMIMMWNDGSGSFDSYTQMSSLYAWGVYGAALNDDNLLDLGISNETDQKISVIFNEGNGDFGTPVPYQSGIMAQDIVAGDFDNDLDLDLANTNEISDNLKVFYNNDGNLDNSTFFATEGHHSKSLVSGDFDADGDLDLAMGCSWENTMLILFNSPGPYYPYLPGDCNMREGNWPPHVWGNDITYLVQYFRSPPDGGEYKCLFDGFFAAADADGNCDVIGIDINPLFYYLMGLEAYDTISFCEDYPPAWRIETDCPVEAPAEWPNCDPIARDDNSPKDVFVEIWIGNQDGSPIEATIGEKLNVDVYIQTGLTTWGGNLHIPLGTNDLYIEDLLSQDEGQFYDDMLLWDYKGFSVPFGSPPNPEGWSSQSFMVITNLAGGPGLYLHKLTPTKMLSFVVKTVDDPALDGQTLDCFDIGYAKCSWPLFCGDSTGTSDISLPITINFSQVHFSLAPPGYPYLAGDANMANETVDLENPLTGPWRVGGDVTFLVNYFDITSGNQPCLIYNPNNTDDYQGGPVNGFYFASADATGEGLVTGGDVSRLVAYFGGTAEIKWYGWDKPNPQNYYPPMWLNNRGSGLEQSVPPLDELPDGWPNCEALPPGAARVIPSHSAIK